jgi:hypothetical protein
MESACVMTNPVDEILGEDVDDDEAITISWLAPLLAEGSVRNTRRAGGPLPFYLVNHLSSEDSVEESYSDTLLSVHVLTHKSAGDVANRDEANRMHQRMLLLARYLEDVALPGGRTATIEFVDVAERPRRTDYGDENILRRTARYKFGLDFAEVQ